MVALYMDVHVPGPITEQLRQRGVNVMTAQDDGSERLADDQLLLRAHELGRVLFTQDIRFKALAQSWQQQQRPFSGLVFGHQLCGTIGRYVKDLELIAKASEPEEWLSVVAQRLIAQPLNPAEPGADRRPSLVPAPPGWTIAPPPTPLGPAPGHPADCRQLAAPENRRK